MDDILKGNFKVKKSIQITEDKRSETDNQKPILKEELKKRALASLGGSMVYMDRTAPLVWNGDE